MASQRWQVFGAQDMPDLLAQWPPTPDKLLRDNSKLQAFVWHHQEQRLFVKCFRYQGLRRLAARFGRERGLAGFRAAERLRAAGIDTPAALALVRDSNCRSSWLLTQMLDSTTNCHQLAEAGLSDDMKQQLLQAGLALLVKLHQSGHAHGDFKWANLMWQQTQDRLWLIDLDGVKACRPGSKPQLRDLARFLLNAEEVGLGADVRDAAFQSYCAQMQLLPELARRHFDASYQRLWQRHQRKTSSR